MSLSHAILGLLSIQPMSGYDLKHLAFDQTVAHFWRADQAQIYRTLDKMAGEGWVISELEIQEDRPNRKVYQITPGGKAELERWLGEEQALYTHREAFLVQLFFASSLPDEVILQHIEAQIAGHQARLAAYHEIDMPVSPDAVMRRQQQFWQMTLDFGIALEETYLRWLEQCKQKILSSKIDE